VKGAWIEMLRYQGPSCIILTRQKLPDLEGRGASFKKSVDHGAYIIYGEHGACDFGLFATGSEVSLAIDVAKALEKHGKKVRVVSMPCWEIFEQQDESYIDAVVGGDIGQRVSIEAGVSLGWHKWIGTKGIAVAIDRFGASAPIDDLQKEFGFNVDAILERLL